MKKKVKSPKLSEKVIFNIRLNKQLLSMFSIVCSNKYNIKTISKGFSLALNTLFHSFEYEDIIYNFSFCDLSPYENDKKFSLSLSTEDMLLLEKLSSNIGMDKSDIFRKIILFEICNYYFLVPNQNKIDFSKKSNNCGYTKFNFRFNKNTLDLFLQIYSEKTGEKNLTSALNNLIKNTISDSKRQSKEIIIGLTSQKNSDIVNDYKLNFTISNKRYSGFVSACSLLGISPHDCLRKKILLYIQENNQ